MRIRAEFAEMLDMSLTRVLVIWIAVVGGWATAANLGTIARQARLRAAIHEPLVSTREGRAAILVYHRFRPVASDMMTVRTSTFRWQLRYLQEHRYTVVLLRALTSSCWTHHLTSCRWMAAWGTRCKVRLLLLESLTARIAMHFDVPAAGVRAASHDFAGGGADGHVERRRLEMLFTDRSLWTMVHGIGLGGAALMGLAAALFYLYAARTSDGTRASAPYGSRALSALTVLTAVMLWLTVLAGTYIVFPPYRATPPAGVTDLTQFPRSLIQASPDTAWLHSFAMESKEHAPWIACMLATAVAFVCVQYRWKVLTDRSVRTMATILLAICLGLVSFVSLMGVFVNKVAPLQ